MRKCKKVLTFIFLSVFVLGFIINITEVPSIAEEGDGGTYCDDRSFFRPFCWAYPPNWSCTSMQQSYGCVDPQVE